MCTRPKAYRMWIFVIGSLLLVWGIQDLYHYYRFGIDTIEQFLGTGAENTIKEMVYGNLKNGYIKILLGAIVYAVSIIGTVKKKVDSVE